MRNSPTTTNSSVRLTLLIASLVFAAPSAAKASSTSAIPGCARLQFSFSLFGTILLRWLFQHYIFAAPIVAFLVSTPTLAETITVPSHTHLQLGFGGGGQDDLHCTAFLCYILHILLYAISWEGWLDGHVSFPIKTHGAGG